MTMTVPVARRIHFGSGRAGHREIRNGAAKKPPPSGRIPHIARLMALAIWFDELLRTGAVADYGELARLGHVSRPRITQIMDLLQLAPDIQETLLFLPPVERGKDPVTEREMRAVVAEVEWQRQRRAFSARWSSVRADSWIRSAVRHEGSAP